MTSVSKKLSDDQLSAGIQSVGRQRTRLERSLYDQYVYLIARAQLQHKLEYEECVSAYSDAILAVINQVANRFFEGRSSLKTYLYRLFYNKCIDCLRDKQKIRNRVHQTLALDDRLMAMPDPARSVVEQFSTPYDVDELREELVKLGTKNRALLIAWGEGYSDAELARQFGYRSAAVAKTTRLRCLRQLRQRLKPPSLG